MNKEEILYEKTGLIYTEHPKVIEAMTEFADTHLKEQFAIYSVSHRRELLIDFFRTVSKVRVEDKGNMHTVTKAVDDYLKDN
tara:strand:+ start:209 stop:454 length:246 start_codon:yes stop_codon:yes gene_type:complete